MFDPRLLFRQENYKRSILLNYRNMVKLIKNEGLILPPSNFSKCIIGSDETLRTLRLSWKRKLFIYFFIYLFL